MDSLATRLPYFSNRMRCGLNENEQVFIPFKIDNLEDDSTWPRCVGRRLDTAWDIELKMTVITQNIIEMHRDHVLNN